MKTEESQDWDAPQWTSGDLWATEITHVDGDTILLRGHRVDELMTSASFASVLLLLWTGRESSPADERLVNACLIASADHGAGTPSAAAARTAASTGNRSLASVATGLLATGPLHGAAVTNAMMMLDEGLRSGNPETWAQRRVDEARSRGGRLPGLGHRNHRVDPRTVRLFQLLEEQDRGFDAMETYESLRSSLSNAVGKKLCINVDGAIAVAATVLGLEPRFGDCIFGVARTVGLSAHVVEEKTTFRPMRAVNPSAATYRHS